MAQICIWPPSLAVRVWRHEQGETFKGSELRGQLDFSEHTLLSLSDGFSSPALFFSGRALTQGTEASHETARYA